MDGFDLELISLNTRGLRDYRKRRTVFNWLKKHIHKNAVIIIRNSQYQRGRKDLKSAVER